MLLHILPSSLSASACNFQQNIPPFPETGRGYTNSFFYPVLNQRYAEEIAGKWNTKDHDSGYKGYVTQFEIDDDYISSFTVQVVGASYHQELWIPAEELDNFNNHIIGKIEIIKVLT